jgi:adenosylcobinamide-phosphate synthase
MPASIAKATRPVRRNSGAWTTIGLLAGALILGHPVQTLLLALPLGWLLLAIVMSTLIAQKSLYDHVAAVASGLETGGLGGGRLAVSRIVGRDPEALDQAGVSRAAIESLAENFSDGVVAPVFWAALLGLPACWLKVINTADSMIGHKARHRFGWAAALDDPAESDPTRLSGLIMAPRPGCCPGPTPRRLARDRRVPGITVRQPAGRGRRSPVRSASRLSAASIWRVGGRSLDRARRPPARTAGPHGAAAVRSPAGF